MNKEKVRQWFLDNFTIHTDWVGDWIEYENKNTTIEELVEKFFRDIENG